MDMDIEEETNLDSRATPLGLYSKDEILPLFSTEINDDIYDRFAKVTLTHIYYQFL